MKILYIEDDPKLSELICNLLHSHGYEVEHFVLGWAGLDRFYQNPEAWDVVILDLELPDKPGQAIMAEIAERRPNLPILVHSGFSGLKERFELFTTGATAMLPKPAAGQDLIDLLKHLIETPPESIL